MNTLNINDIKLSEKWTKRNDILYLTSHNYGLFAEWFYLVLKDIKVCYDWQV